MKTTKYRVLKGTRPAWKRQSALNGGRVIWEAYLKGERAAQIVRILFLTAGERSRTTHRYEVWIDPAYRLPGEFPYYRGLANAKAAVEHELLLHQDLEGK